MKLQESNLSALASALIAERKRQKLSREEAAAICGVSTSFIRDAESHPENCSLGKLVRLLNGLGLHLEVPMLSATPAKGLIAAAMEAQHAPTTRVPDFGVPAPQLITASTPTDTARRKPRSKGDDQ